MQKLIITVLLALAFSCTNNEPNISNKQLHDSDSTIQTAKEIKTIEELSEAINSPNDDLVLVVAHRGHWRGAPENSMEAIVQSYEMGVDIVEIDVRMTSDSVLVLLHDKTLDRTTTGTGLLSEITFDSLQKFYLKNGAGMKTNHKVPTLKEALEYAKNKPLMLNLDKAWDNIPSVAKLLRLTYTTQHAILKGNATYDELKSTLGVLLDSIIYMPMVWPSDYSIYANTPSYKPAEFVQTWIDNYKAIAFEVIYNNEQSEVFEAIDLIRQGKSSVWVNTLWPELCASHHDDVAFKSPDLHWGWVIENGANIIQTDRPVQLLDYLRAKGLHN